MPEAPHKADGSRYRYLDLVNGDRATHLAVMRGGTGPSFESLAGWEFAGANANAGAELIGVRKFKKGFYEGGVPRVDVGPTPFLQGYNVLCFQDGLYMAHRAKPNEEHPKRFGFYRVHAVQPGARDNVYEHALLLDYGLGANGVSEATLLRDYLVQVYPDDPDLLLGHAFYALPFGLRVSLGFFVLSRMNRHDFRG